MGVFSGGGPGAELDAMRAAVRAMMSESRHRGPDAEGMVEIAAGDDSLVLGHRRLSILDLSKGSQQPIGHEETGSWLVYNGEIYNFRELRRELETRGVRFRTSGDTEVLLAALVEWGEAALGKLEGMFAFAFWDGRAKTLLVARDRMGIKPLYYHAGAGRFVFASEVKVLERAAIIPLTVDEEGVDSFLAYGAVTRPRTIWREIRELGPGHWLRLRAPSELEEGSYWSLEDALEGAAELSAGRAVNFEDAVARIRERLKAAVSGQLVSDVPVGVFLSGGVDSSLLALEASRCATSEITLLTVAFPEQEFSELPYAREIARGLPHRHEVVTLSAEELRGLLPGALAAMDQPTLDGMNTYVICRAGAARGLKVLLSGVGGDEVFGGYSTFAKVPRLQRYASRYGTKLQAAARLMATMPVKNPIPWKKIGETVELRNITDAYLLQRSVRWRRKGTESPAKSLQQKIEGLSNDFQKVAALELQFYMRNQLLRDADVFSMAHSVELRVPLLDTALVEAALSLAPEHHFSAGRGKRITRKIAGELMGAELPQRPKMGFTFPWRQWLRQALRETIAQTLRSRELYEPFGLDPAYGEKMLQGLERDDPRQTWSEVWSLFVLLNWQARNGVECAVA